MDLTIKDNALLEYVCDQTRDDIRGRVDLQNAPMDHEVAISSARKLIAEGLLILPSVGDDVSITPFGREFCSRMREQRNNAPARIVALRLAILHWLYDHHLHNATPHSMADFSASQHAIYAGQYFTSSDIAHVVSYLREASLIFGAQSEQESHLTNPALTARGVACSESEKSVSEFLNPPASSGPKFDVKIEGSQNVVVGTQSDFTQNSNPGIDPDVLVRLIHFATVAREGLPSLSLDEAQQAEVESVSRELEAAAGESEPERGRLRRLTNRLVTALEPATASALGAVVSALGQQAASSISG
ncbi:hypothetical protein [Streptomyces sp. H39-C1]|uniref:hypothetical protein n=1 Tax=Streptomyces sp. H39-C1 TaxID=3004355 RepID=UPI0022AEC028|nr:hypothetical protein [Streptomyces sp. H39-C1]MCZ4095990.1 hypothetical protein [Streptomyces sp. H39-C1]